MSLANSLRVRGVGGTVELALRRAFNFDHVPEHLLSRMVDLRRYDRKHHVNTAGLVELDKLDIDSPSKAHGTRYGGASPWQFRDLLESLPIDASKYTFIDIGSGKGAALFQASNFPFREIIGVEFSPALHDDAVRNLKTFRSDTQKCHKITPVCADATQYVLPEAPWVLFFNCPFDATIWKPVAESLARTPRGTETSYLIHMSPGFLPGVREFVENLYFLKLSSRMEYADIFEFRAGPGPQ
jgi:SAM-dependent methyltransferase